MDKMLKTPRDIQSLEKALHVLDDYSGSLNDLITRLVAIRTLYGGKHVVKFDAGHNNVSCTLVKFSD